MAKTKTVQNSFVSGVMNEKAFGRTDVARFYSSVAEAENVILHTTGGLFKRPGFEYIDDTAITYAQTLVTNSNRLVDFVFNTDQKYLFLFRPGNIDIYAVPLRTSTTSAIGGPIATIATAILTPTIIKEMCIVQRGDVTILFHTTMEPRILTRISYSSFTFAILDMIEPKDPNGVAYWSPARGYPSYATFFQGRLYCAGSALYPLTVWGSKSQAYFDFDIAVADKAAATSPITDTIDSDKINRITGIFAGRNLQLFTTGAEFVNLSQIITPTDSSWAIQTRAGSNPNVPFDSIDGSTFYIDRYSAIREFIYDFNQDSHISNDLTTLSSHLFNNPFRIEIVKSATSNLARFTYVLNEDGTLVVLNFNKAEGIIAWVSITHPIGKILDISTVDNELYILVQTSIGAELQRLDLSPTPTYLDSYTKLVGNKPNIFCGTGGLSTISCTDSVGGDFGINYFLSKKWCPTCTIFTDINTPPITTITGLSRFNGTEVSYVLDGIYRGETTISGGILSVDQIFSTIQIGYRFNSKIKTLPLASPGVEMELAEKRIIKIKLFLSNSSGFYINDEFIPSAFFESASYDTAAPVRTGVYEYWTLGWDTFSQFVISALDPIGFNILKHEIHVDVSE